MIQWKAMTLKKVDKKIEMFEGCPTLRLQFECDESLVAYRFCLGEHADNLIRLLRAFGVDAKPDTEYDFNDYVGMNVQAKIHDERIMDFKGITQ